MNFLTQKIRCKPQILLDQEWLPLWRNSLVKALKPLCFLASFFSVLLCPLGTLEPLLHFTSWLFIHCWPQKKYCFTLKEKTKKLCKILTGLAVWQTRKLWTNCHWQHTCSHSYFRADTPKVNFEILYNGQFILSTQLIKDNFLVIFPDKCSTIVS